MHCNVWLSWEALHRDRKIALKTMFKERLIQTKDVYITVMVLQCYTYAIKLSISEKEVSY